ncbi:hypothetical protein [Nocardioides zeae]
MTAAGDDRLDLAHAGLGNTADLPVPIEGVITGSVLALAASFLVLALAWRRPRYESGRGDVAVPWLDAVVGSRLFRAVARCLGVAFLAFLLFALVQGPDYAVNPGLGMFYVLLWVGVVPLSLLLGPVYRTVSPVRAINSVLARLGRTDPDVGLWRLPDRLGVWPAALGLFSFVWLELVSSSAATTSSVRLWVVAYVAIMLVGGVAFGSDFHARADPFEVYSTLVAHLSPWARDHDGRLVLRSPLANLASTPPTPGLVAVVAVLFGSTAFDSFRESLPFIRFVQNTTISSALILNVTLAGLCLLVGLLLASASVGTRRGHAVPLLTMPARMAHSIVPIIVGYVAAHYVTLLLEYGQQVVVYMSDPLVDGSDWFGTADLEPAYFLSGNTPLLASVQVGGVVLGHIVGAVAAHDRALAVLPADRRVVGQLPMLALMVTLTAGGLFLLFAS